MAKEKIEYKSLSREDKIYNLQVTKRCIEEKIENLNRQLEGINDKLAKLNRPSEH